jgi:DNA-binding Lrp family transcriptional regulator
MVIACILIGCKAGRYREIAEKLNEIEGVKEVFSVHGRWDVVAEVEVEDLRELSEVALKINSLEGVRATETLIALEEV